MELSPWDVLANTISGLVKPVARVERVSLHGANGRTLAEPVVAMRPLPTHDHAVMDGYVLGLAPPGHYTLRAPSLEPLAPHNAMVIAAGEPVPAGAACVVLADRAEVSGATLIVNYAPRKDNLRRVGEETAVGDVIVPEKKRLDARHCALATASGNDTVVVRKRPRIALVGIHGLHATLPHLAVVTALLDSSRLILTLAGTVQNALLPDLLQRLSMDHDMIVVVAESLGAEHGILAAAIAAVGGKTTVHRAALKPAKPVVTGHLGQTTLIGVAGTAYAVTIAAHLFVRPVLMKLLGEASYPPLQTAAADFSRTREVVRTHGVGRAEALPVTANHQERARPLTLSSAGRFGQLRALANMDGFAIVDAAQGDVTPGTPFSYMPLLMPLV